MRDEPFSVTPVTSRPTVNINHDQICPPALAVSPGRSGGVWSVCQVRGVQSARGVPPAGGGDGAGEAGLHHLLPGTQTSSLAPPASGQQHQQQVGDKQVDCMNSSKL